MFDSTEPEVELLLRWLPAFAGRYRALVEATDGDPGAALVFEELADFTGALLAEVQGTGTGIVEVMSAVEEVAGTSPDAEELVGAAFLDNLSPDQRQRLGWCMGRRTQAVLDELELPPDATGTDPGR